MLPPFDFSTAYGIRSPPVTDAIAPPQVVPPTILPCEVHRPDASKEHVSVPGRSPRTGNRLAILVNHGDGSGNDRSLERRGRNSRRVLTSGRFFRPPISRAGCCSPEGSAMAESLRRVQRVAAGRPDPARILAHTNSMVCPGGADPYAVLGLLIEGTVQPLVERIPWERQAEIAATLKELLDARMKSCGVPDAND
jgi:hypothetical protein